MNISKDIKYIISLGKIITRFLVKGLPLAKTYDITYRCNLNCKHCYFYKNHTKIEVDPISDEEWRVIFKNEKNTGVYEIYLTGGEPMLRPRVIEYATEIFGARHVNIVTNGTIKIPAHWCNNIFVSIDGDEETQMEIRGGNILSSIISNIKNNRRVLISATISRLNYKKIKDIYKISKEANVKGVSFSFYTGKTREDAVDGEILNEAVESLKEIKKQDPDYVIVTEKMLNVLKTKSHVKNCVLRKGLIVSHLPNMEIKKPCIFGMDIDCSNCGCHLPIVAECLKSFDVETIKLMRKVYS